MTLPSGILDAQVQRLLDMVNAFQKNSCNALLQDARVQAADIVRNTYIQSRGKLHKDIAQTRERMQAECAAAQAKQQTLLQQRGHEMKLQFLSKAWDTLQESVLRRWQDDINREAWILKIIHSAQHMLPPGDWVIEHPASFNTQEIERLFDGNVARLSFKSCDELLAGIRISFNSAMIDGSLQGLVYDRTRIEAELLAACVDCVLPEDIKTPTDKEQE